MMARKCFIYCVMAFSVCNMLLACQGSSNDEQLQARLNKSQAWVSDQSTEGMTGAQKASYDEWITDVSSANIQSLSNIEPAGIMIRFSEIESELTGRIRKEWIVSGFYLADEPTVTQFRFVIDGDLYNYQLSERGITGAAKKRDKRIFYPLWETIPLESDLGKALHSSSSVEIALIGDDGRESEITKVYMDN